MAQDRQVVIETVQVTKIFRDFWMRKKVKALDRVDLQVFRGEIFGLLGPNGSGKSTLVKILLGLLFPDSGRAAIFRRDPRNVRVKDRIGYMPEESYLYRYLNAEETLNFYGRLFNLPRRERRRRVDLLLDMVGLREQRRRPLVEYSKGMARRIGLAQALINDPDLVFLDEPTTGLDPIGTREIKDLILELKKRGKTVFLCSHLLSDVEDICDRVAILYGGRLRRLGSVGDLLKVRAMTQIVAPQLQPETVERILSLIREAAGPEVEVSVDAPRERLETLFLRVIEEARSARLETAGTTVGAGAQTFFAGISREDRAEALLQELLKTSAERKAEAAAGPEEQKPETVVLPASGPEPEPVKVVVEQLVSGGKRRETKAAAAQPEEAPPVVLPAGGVEERRSTAEDVIKDLLKPKRPADQMPEEPEKRGTSAGSERS